MITPTLNYMTNVFFDVRVNDVLPEVLLDLGITRPILITDPGLKELGILDRLGVDVEAVYDQVQTNPSEASAMKALDVYLENECDGCVGIGGGSSMDLAKVVALLVGHNPPLCQYAFIHGGVKQIKPSLMPPVVAVPTTAGSGSEVGRAALVSLDTGDKLALISPALVPKVAVCDPDLTLSMPTGLTAATGMDAISHCVETYCSPRFNPIAESIAIDGLARGWENIRKVTMDGTDRNARLEMLTAALAGGLTFQKGLGAVHSLSHALGAFVKRPLHHGTLNAIFLPHVVRFNLKDCRQKLQIISDRLHLDSADGLPDALAELVLDLGLPTCLKELGVTAEDLQPFAAKALADHCSVTNPRTMSIDDCVMLYDAAL